MELPCAWFVKGAARQRWAWQRDGTQQADWFEFRPGMRLLSNLDTGTWNCKTESTLELSLSSWKHPWVVKRSTSGFVSISSTGQSAVSGRGWALYGEAPIYPPRNAWMKALLNPIRSRVYRLVATAILVASFASALRLQLHRGGVRARVRDISPVVVRLTLVAAAAYLVKRQIKRV